MPRITPTKPQFDIITSQAQVNLFLAGQGSGKSHCAGIVSACHISKYPDVRGLIAANTHDQLTKATLFRIREVWKNNFGIVEYNDKTKKGDYVSGKRPPSHFSIEGHNFKDYNNIISFSNGGVIYIGSLENYYALDGIEIGWAVLDETKDTKEEAVKEVITGRLRQTGMFNAAGEPFNPLYIFTSPAKVPWINEWFNLEEYEPEIVSLIYSKTTYFRKKIDNKFVVISSTYLNAANLPENYIPNQLANLNSSLVDMLIYANPFSKSGGEFFDQFDRAKHVKQVRYDEDLPIHVSFDKNVSPYIACSLWQLQDKQITQIHELPCKEPDNTSVKASKKLCAYLRSIDYDGVIYLYGDTTANARSATDQEGKSFFEKIIETLRNEGYIVVNRVGKSNPRIMLSGEFVNAIYENQYGGYSIAISDLCKISAMDYGIVKKGVNGEMLKIESKNPDTGKPYQPYGHFSDVKRYFICQMLKDLFDKYGRNSGSATFLVRRNN